jgi:hypothetical protein
MSFKSIKNWIWMVLCLAALAALTGCQSGSPLDLGDEALSDTQNAGEAPAPIVSDEPVLPKGSSDWQQFDPEVSETLKDLLFDLRHIPLQSGDNCCIDPQDYMYKSSNVEHDGGDVVLKSTTGQMSYVTYGFRNIPEGEEIIKVTVRGTMDTQLFNPFGGLYIGISDYDLGQFRWFGPLGTENEYELPLWNIDTTNDSQRAYVTLAVYNGDHYTVQDIDVKVGTQFVIPDFDWKLFEMREYFQPDGTLDLHEMELGLFSKFPIPGGQPPVYF